MLEKTCAWVLRSGRTCSERFKTPFPFEILCPTCRKRLPECKTCGLVMGGTRYGYLVDVGAKLGGLTICGWCVREMKRKGFLRIGRDDTLLPTGEIRRRPRIARQRQVVRLLGLLEYRLESVTHTMPAPSADTQDGRSQYAP